MDNSINDIRVGPNYFFIKTLRFSENPTLINGNYFWKLNSDPQAIFRLRGYIRFEKNVIYIVPDDYDKNLIKQYKLFDFRSSEGDSWKTVHKNGEYYSTGDSVVYLKKKITPNHDTVYSYSLYPFTIFKETGRYRYLDPVIDLEISKTYGFISIKIQRADRFGYDYKLYLYPKILFLNTKIEGQPI